MRERTKKKERKKDRYIERERIDTCKERENLEVGKRYRESKGT